MRHLLAAALVLSVSPVAAAELPSRKPGLWEIKMTMESAGLPPQLIQQCIDAATDQQMQSFGNGMTKQSCTKNNVQRSGATLTIDSECNFGGTTTTSHAVVTRSFDSAYTMKMTSKADRGETRITMEAKWLGACKADQRPGDMIMPGGIKVNVQDMQRGMPGGAPTR